MAAMDATMTRTTSMDGAMDATMLAPWCYDKGKSDGSYNDKDNVKIYENISFISLFLRSRAPSRLLAMLDQASWEKRTRITSPARTTEIGRYGVWDPKV